MRITIFRRLFGLFSRSTIAVKTASCSTLLTGAGRFDGGGAVVVVGVVGFGGAPFEPIWVRSKIQRNADGSIALPTSSSSGLDSAICLTLSKLFAISCRLVLKSHSRVPQCP